MSTRVWTRYEGPLGPLTLVAGPKGPLAMFFAGRSPLLNEADRQPDAFADTVAQLEEYFNGDRADFDVALDLGNGTPFSSTCGTSCARSPTAPRSATPASPRRSVDLIASAPWPPQSGARPYRSSCLPPRRGRRWSADWLPRRPAAQARPARPRSTRRRRHEPRARPPPANADLTVRLQPERTRP